MKKLYGFFISFSLVFVCCAVTPTDGQKKFENGRNLKIEKGYIPTDDGTRLFYRKIGNGRQKIIIPADLYLFEDFRQLAGKQRTLIFYDMRGRGLSDMIPDKRKSKLLGINHDVKDVERIRKHFKIEKFSLIGYSYLGMMSVLYALEHPARVERIVQIGPVPLKFGTKYPDNLTNKDKLTDLVPDAKEVEKVRKLRDAGYDKTNPKDYCEKLWNVLRYDLVGNPANAEKLGKSQCDKPNEYPINLAKHFQYSFASVQKLDIPKEKVARLKIPVLTIHGTKDRNAPYGSGREWATILSDARLLTIKGAAHNLWVDAPDEVFSAIRLFLQGKWTEKAEKVL